MPLDPSYPDARIKLVAEDAEVKALLVKDKDALVKIGGIVKCPVLSVTNIIDDALLPEPSTVAWRPYAPNTSCYAMYTSGNTGRPKGVVLDHANFSSFIQHGALRIFKDLDPGSRFLLSSPMTFDMSCGIQFSALSMGATLVLAPKCKLLDELELLINTEKVSLLVCQSRNITCMLCMLQGVQLFF